MMSARSTPNLQQTGRQESTASNQVQPANQYFNQFPTTTTQLENNSPPPTPPVREAYSLKGGKYCSEPFSSPPTPPVRDGHTVKSSKYGPGHEKFPSWPVPASADTPQAVRAPPSGGSHRSKSWTEHTSYPKEKLVTYTRPYMRSQHSYNKQLKTVMERCEKIPSETYEKVNERIYYPKVDRDGKNLGDMEYIVPSPPERDTNKQITQEDLDQYRLREYDLKSLPHLTQADLEEYTRKYEDTLTHQHAKQPSYAQSEGYHSYVSSTDSTATPFLDRLRRDSNVRSVWEDPDLPQEGRDSVVTTSSGSASSSETLKWHGSMSDVSVSSSCTHLANSSKQLIAHSARVQTPQRHHSESVLYMGEERHEGWKDRENWNNSHNKLKLFPVSTYTVQPEQEAVNQRLNSLSSQTSLSVADRVNELERQHTKYSYLDPEKKHRVSDPTLKAIQKKALLSFYERHHSTSSKSSWRSEPQLAQSAVPQAPHPPPRPQPQTPSRRASCASDYASSLRKSNVISLHESKTTDNIKVSPKHQHSNSCGSLSTDLLGPVIMGPSISIDDWVPERPPKKPHLRSVYPDLFQEPRVPSPDLPPPSPPVVLETEVLPSDEPLPPPPPEIDGTKWENDYADRLKGKPAEDLRQTTGLPEPERRPNRPESLSRQSSLTESLSISRQTSLDRDKQKQTLDYNLRSSVRMSQRLRPTHSPTKTFSRESHRQSFIEQTKRQQKLMANQKIPNGEFHSESLRSYKPPLLPPTEEKRKPPAQLPLEIRNGHEYGKGHDYSKGQDFCKRQEMFRDHEHKGSEFSKGHDYSKGQDFCKRQDIYKAQEIFKEHELKGSDFSKGHDYSKVQDFSKSNDSSKGDFQRGFEHSRQHDFSKNHDLSKAHDFSKAPSKGHDFQRGFEHSKHHGLDFSKLQEFSKSHDLNFSRSHDLSFPKGHELSFSKGQRSSYAEHSEHMPPPLHPRQMRNYQSMRGRHSEAVRRMTPPRQSPPKEELSTSHLSFNMSQSKASYLASRREREHGLPNSDIGSYKRTMSPSGQHLQSSNENLGAKDYNTANNIRNNNNTSLLRRASLVEAKCPSKKEIVLKCDTETEKCNLPDVLPINAKVSPSRSQYIRNVLEEKKDRLTPPGSPQKSSQSSPKQEVKVIPSEPISAECRVPKTNSPELRIPKPNSPELLSPDLRRPKSNSPDLRRPKSNSPELRRLKPSSPDIHLSQPNSPELRLPAQISDLPSSPKPTTPEPISTSISPISSPVLSPSEEERPKVIEGLQLIQRTEVTLRVNTCTIDASSQTEKEELQMTPIPTRKKLQEEIDCEKLSQDLVSYLSPSDRLKGILVPGPEHKKPTDYVSGLFKVEVTSRSRPANSPFRSRNTTPNSSPPPSITSTSTAASQTDHSHNKTITTEVIIPVLEPSSPLSATSTYFTTSESKAKFLTRYSRDMSHYNICKDTKDLNQKKEELVSRLDRKLEVLRSEQLVVTEECRMNDELGENVERHVGRVARPHEAAKFKLHVEEVGKITSLLLGLSGRLARVENALMEIPPDHTEKKVLEEKRDKLQSQLEEAKKLKESIDKRSISVSNMLYKYLNSEEYADYDHFINMKAKLIMDSREISDKIKLGEEQLVALKETLTTNL